MGLTRGVTQLEEQLAKGPIEFGWGTFAPSNDTKDTQTASLNSNTMTDLFNKLMPSKAEETQAQMAKSAADSKKVQLTKILSIASNIKAIHVKTRSYAKHMALMRPLTILTNL